MRGSRWMLCLLIGVSRQFKYTTNKYKYKKEAHLGLPLVNKKLKNNVDINKISFYYNTNQS